MPLSDDQKAMLRLLAQREQGYEDLAALMGLSVDEVRVKVKDALAQLEQEGEPAPSLPVEPPEPVAPAPVEPAAPEPVATPPQSKPAPEVEPAAPAAKPPAPAAKRTPPPRPKLPLPGGGARAAIVAGLAVVVLVIVILVVGGGDSDSDGTTTAASGAGTTAAEETAGNASANGKEVTQAVLEAVDGSDAKGVATFGRVKNSLALQVEATGLAPTAKDQSYTVWLAQSPQKMLPLATTAVTKSGQIGAQVEVPTEVLGYLAKGTFTKIVISLTDNAALKAALAKATSEKKAPIYTGTEVLNGTVTGPIVGAADKQKSE